MKKKIFALGLFCGFLLISSNLAFSMGFLQPKAPSSSESSKSPIPFYFSKPPQPPNISLPKPIERPNCTAEVKTCPDGSRMPRNPLTCRWEQEKCKSITITPAPSSSGAPIQKGLCNGGKLSELSNYKGSEGKYKSASSDDYIYYAGYQQMTSDDQDAFAIKADKQGNVCWNKRLTGATSKSTPDERCSDLAIAKEDNKQFIYLVCRTDGGSYSGFTIPTSPAPFQKSYGNGGGPAASVILKLNPDNGNTVAATYLRGTLSSTGKTNTINIKTVSPSAEYVEVSGETAWGAPTTDSTKRCKGGSYKARLSLNLSNLLYAFCGGGEQSL